MLLRLAVLTVGVLMAGYGHTCLNTEEAAHMLHAVWTIVVYCAETIIFVLAGAIIMDRGPALLSSCCCSSALVLRIRRHLLAKSCPFLLPLTPHPAPSPKTLLPPPSSLLILHVLPVQASSPTTLNIFQPLSTAGCS